MLPYCKQDKEYRTDSCKSLEAALQFQQRIYDPDPLGADTSKQLKLGYGKSGPYVNFTAQLTCYSPGGLVFGIQLGKLAVNKGCYKDPVQVLNKGEVLTTLPNSSEKRLVEAGGQEWLMLAQYSLREECSPECSRWHEEFLSVWRRANTSLRNEMDKRKEKERLALEKTEENGCDETGNYFESTLIKERSTVTSITGPLLVFHGP
ncbi:hypothetical protein OS493_039925 [Desmophyllum pertusum]|uniref:Uncharacterized protein n=1 Tax=Desmophyllum pertusum TaxID=174260 RepID=A0A9X0CPD0_9CNID|nr:hypothetical protein OS493_039925 [Desmophyllum pertusum]